MRAADLKQIDQLKIYRQQLLAGVISRTRDGCELRLDDSFISDPQFNELTYCISKSQKIWKQSGVNLLPFFAGLLPEGLRLKSLVKNLKTSEDDLFTILAAIGESCVGDVYALAEGIQRKPIEISDSKKINFYDFFYQSVESKTIRSDLEAISGVQEKVSASMISFPTRLAKKDKSYILKLNSKNIPNLVQNEFRCVSLANLCELTVNKVMLVYDKDKNPGLLVERFDRSGADKIHQEDACQFMNLYPADKYRVSMRDIADEIMEISTAPLVDIAKLIQLYAFSYLVGNGDLHAKNISLQTNSKTGRVHLTPAYDLICTYIYKDRHMALKMEGRDSNIKRRDFLAFAKHYDLSFALVNSMLDRLIKNFKANLDLLFGIELLSSKDKKLLVEMTKSRLQDLK